MAKATEKEYEPKTEIVEFEFVAEYQTDKEGHPDESRPRPLFVDDLQGKRVAVVPGTRFTAHMVEEIAIDRRGKEPKDVPTGVFAVASSDIDVLPGCLTSCIRTGRAVPVK